MKSFAIVFFIAAFAAAFAAAPVEADEVEDSLQLALEAYQAGDIASAREELSYISQVLAQMEAAAFSELLPEAPPGWTRAVDGNGGGIQAGIGGIATSATYSNDNSQMKLQLMAENQLVASMIGMFGNTAMLGNLGQVKRIKRQTVVIDKRSDLQAIVDKRILVQINGSASIEDKEMLFGSIDLRALRNF